MRIKILNILIGALLALSLSGCGDTQNQMTVQNSGFTKSYLTRPFSDMLYGFAKIEKYAARGDYKSAKTISKNLYDEFHDTILPSLAAKKGQQYAEDIHAKYDELEEAIRNKDKAKITELVNVNRDNLKTIAPMLGVSLISL